MDPSFDPHNQLTGSSSEPPFQQSTAQFNPDPGLSPSVYNTTVDPFAARHRSAAPPPSEFASERVIANSHQSDIYPAPPTAMYTSHNPVHPSVPAFAFTPPSSHAHPSQSLSTIDYHHGRHHSLSTSVYDFAPPPMNQYPHGTANIDYGAGATTVAGFGIALPDTYATQSDIIHPYSAEIASNHSNLQATHMGHSAPPAVPVAPWGAQADFHNRMVPLPPHGTPPGFHARGGAPHGANTGQSLSYGLPTRHPSTFQPNVNPPHATNVHSAVHPHPPTATNPTQQMLESLLADVSAFNPTPPIVLSQTPSVRRPFRDWQRDLEYEASSLSPFSRHTPISHLSPFRTPSHSLSRRSTPYERPPPLPAPIPAAATVTDPSSGAQPSVVPGPSTVPANDGENFTNRVADELALLLITVGPAITDDKGKAALYQDAFRHASRRVTKPVGATPKDGVISGKALKLWRERKNQLKVRALDGCAEAYGLKAKIPATDTQPERDPTPEEIAERVRRLLSRDFPFLSMDPSNKKRAFDHHFIFELAEYFVFQCKGGLGIKYLRRFNGRYSIVLIALICTTIHCALQCWETGTESKKTFDRNFQTQYDEYYALLAGTRDHPYHGVWLRDLLRSRFLSAIRRRIEDFDLPPDDTTHHPDPTRTAHLYIRQSAIDFNLHSAGNSLPGPPSMVASSFHSASPSNAAAGPSNAVAGPSNAAAGPYSSADFGGGPFSYGGHHSGYRLDEFGGDDYGDDDYEDDDYGDGDYGDDYEGGDPSGYGAGPSNSG